MKIKPAGYLTIAVLDTGKTVYSFSEQYVETLKKFDTVTYAALQEPVYLEKDLRNMQPDFYAVKDTLMSDERHTHWVVDNARKRDGIGSSNSEPAILLSTLRELFDLDGEGKIDD